MLKEPLEATMENHGTEEMEGVEADSKTLLLTPDEKRVLEIYDRLEELQLEIALLKAQGILSQGESYMTIQK